MSEVNQKIIKNMLDIFFGVRLDEATIETETNNPVGIVLDEVDTEILSEAIDQALEKATNNESPN